MLELSWDVSAFSFLLRAEVEWKKSKLQLRVKRSRKGGTFSSDNASSAFPNHNVKCVCVQDNRINYQKPGVPAMNRKNKERRKNIKTKALRRNNLFENHFF